MRRPNERLPQRRLVYELRALIDRGRLDEAVDLLVEHPRGAVSLHVYHNLGTVRRERMIEYIDRLGRARATELGYLLATSARLARSDA